MKRVEKIVEFIKNHTNKYVVAIAIFVVFTFFVGESNIFNRIFYDKQIRQLEQEIDHYTKQKEENLKKIEALQSDNESLEKLAREQYQMTKSDEELFIIKE